MPRTTSDRALSAETRAAKAAGEDMEKVMESFRGMPPFMDQPRSPQTQRVRELIENSPLGKQLMAEGYTQGFAERAAKIERDIAEKE